MKARSLTTTMCLGLWLIVGGCTKPTPPEPRSEIVATVEKAGSGDLSSTPAPQIEDWLRKHRDLAVQVDDMLQGCAGKSRRKLAGEHRRPRLHGGEKRGDVLPSVSQSA